MNQKEFMLTEIHHKESTFLEYEEYTYYWLSVSMDEQYEDSFV